MLTKQSRRRAIVAIAATGITVGGSLGPAYADPADRGTPQPRPAAESGAPAQPAEPAEQQDEPPRSDPARHTPVEVCHLHGDGSYKLLTTDDSALEAHQRHGDLYPVPTDGCPVTDEDEAVDDEAGDQHGAQDATAKERGHAPVTVCHLRGSGSFHELTFDDDALKAHLAHGDLHPVPTDGCPTEDADTGPDTAQQPGSTGDAGTTGTGTGTSTGAVDTTEAVVLGTQKTATGSTAAAGQVAGRSATAADTAAVSPVADVLPQTGAGRIGLLLAAAAALLAAGATLLARRRAHIAR
jgi:LPXTG-motif cell wall-anchored protein